MLHYHILDNRGKTIEIVPSKPKAGGYTVCNLPFSWFDYSDNKWHGGAYNHDSMCISVGHKEAD